MLAMDIVDTLRRDRRVVSQELLTEEQEKQLLERLKDIYGPQGIEVSDDILKEGVRALREERFVYKPTPPSFSRTLAVLYVRRRHWLKLVIAIGIFALLLFLFNDAISTTLPEGD